MKLKKFILPSIFLVITLVAYVIATALFCYTTKPEVSQGEFPFSITYEYKGERGTLSGVYKCKFSGSATTLDEHERYWDGETVYQNPQNVENPQIIDQNDELQTVLALQASMVAGYFMGDPLYQDHYIDAFEPYVEYYDYKNNISLDDENREEILNSIGFKIIETSFPEPIENSFSFSGIRYKADNIIVFNAILFVFFLLTLIFVKKDKDYHYSSFDKSGIVFNFLVGFIAFPFIAVICPFSSIAGGDGELVSQIIYNVPPITLLSLALSVIFRRKGFSKTGFFIQFGGLFMFVLCLILDTLF